MKRRRKAAFNGMSFTRAGNHLTFSEVEDGVPKLLDGEAAKMLSNIIQDFRAAVKCAYFAAYHVTPAVRKKKKKTRSASNTADSIDLTEFHAVLIAFRQYIEIAVIFEEVDQGHTHDHLLSYTECKRSLPLLEKHGITEENMAAKFRDNWSGEMNFKTFSDWCVRATLHSHLTSVHLALDSDGEIDSKDAALALEKAVGIEAQTDEEQTKTKAIALFMQWDSDNSGYIDELEFVTVLQSLNDVFLPEQVHTLFSAADTSKDGKLQYKEFLSWLFK